MFITVKRSGYDRDDQQVCSGKFLILMTDRTKKPIDGKYQVRAIVRFVSMRQFGQFMMGTARIGRKSITLSGAYGSDGLLTDVDPDTFEHGTPLPDTLYDAWAHGGGWNNAGSEAGAMREWAKANLI